MLLEFARLLNELMDKPLTRASKENRNSKVNHKKCTRSLKGVLIHLWEVSLVIYSCHNTVETRQYDHRWAIKIWWYNGVVEIMWVETS